MGSKIYTRQPEIILLIAYLSLDIIIKQMV